MWSKYKVIIVGTLRMLFYNVSALAFLLWKAVSGDGKKVFAVKHRPEKPAVLSEGYLDRFVTVNGLRLHYVEKGDPKNPLMIFVHGFPEFWYSFRYQLEEFSKDYWCVALDQRGYNESDKPSGLEPYLIKHLTADIRELLRHLGREKCILVAHDWGSIVSFEYVFQHMDTIDKYIMMGAPPLTVHREAIMTDEKQQKMSWYITFFQFPKIPELVLRSYDLKSLNVMRSEHTSKADIEAYKYVFGKPGALTPPINYYRTNIKKGRRPMKPPAKCAPGLLLIGEKDNYISKVCGPLAEKRVHNLRFELLKDTDHFCQQSNPSLVNKLMREFLQEKN